MPEVYCELNCVDVLVMMMKVCGTGGADSQNSQGPAESCSSVLRLQSDQTVLYNLTQRRWETLQVVLHLKTRTHGLTLS